MLTANDDYALAYIIQLGLILVRTSSIFILSPLLGRQQIPNTLKIGFALMCAFIFINLHPPTTGVYPYNEMFPLMLAVVRELFVGLCIGMVTLLFFTVIYTAGHIIDMQIGFSMAQVFDSSTGTQVAVTASLLNVVLMICFVIQDGVSKLVYAIGRSFQVIPVGTAEIRPDMMWYMLELFSRCFALAIQISMPLLASALLAEVALGVIVRTAPQMNVFVVGIPLKVIIGLVMLLGMIYVFTNATEGIFEEMFMAMEEWMGGMTQNGT